MPSRLTIALFLLLVGLILALWKWQQASPQRQSKTTELPTIVKQPENFATRTFDPAAPPADMPPMTSGENAECDSNFISNANVGGQTRRTDATHGTLTITQVKVTLQLNLTIWVPVDATQHVIDHEEGHRQISEYYYQSAEQVASRVAANYMGKQVDLSGDELNAEANKVLEQTAADITAEYNRELDTEPTQLLYDSITDHSRNGVIAQDAVAHALKNTAVESAPSANP